MSKSTSLALLVLLLLAQFYVRAHNPADQALFIDEHRHIERAHAISDGMHPAEQSRGKMLLYVWLAPFRSDWSVALHINRTAVALFSLLGSAGLYLIVRHWLSRQMGVLAVGLYSVFPLALFYERMILADGIAAALAVYAVWFAWRLARRPTYARAYQFGAIAALATMAKLTTSFTMAAMPITAALLIGPVPLQQLNRASIERVVRFWWPFALRVAGIFALLWSVSLIPAAINFLQGNRWRLIVTSLFRDEAEPIDYFPDKFTIMTHPAMLIFIAIGIVIGLRMMPKRYTYVLMWLFVAVAPLVIFLLRTPTRYLMIAAFPLVILMVMAIEAISRLPTPLPATRWRAVVTAGPVLWALLFGLPFAINAGDDVEALRLPPIDDWHYFQSPYNTYGYLATFEWLRDNADPAADGTYHLLTVGWMCDKVLEPYAVTDMALVCPMYWHDPDGHVSPEHIEHQLLIDTLLDYTQQNPAVPLYLSIDHEHRVVPNPFPNCAVDWHLLDTLWRPKNGQPITIWAVALRQPEDGFCSHDFVGG